MWSENRKKSSLSTVRATEQVPHMKFVSSAKKLQFNVGGQNDVSKQKYSAAYQNKRYELGNEKSPVLKNAGIHKLKPSRTCKESILKMNNIITQINREQMKDIEMKDMHNEFATPKSPILKQKGVLDINEFELHKLLISKPKIGEKLDVVLSSMISKLKDEEQSLKKSDRETRFWKPTRSQKKVKYDTNGDQNGNSLSNFNFHFTPKANKKVSETSLPKITFKGDTQKIYPLKEKFGVESVFRRNTPFKSGAGNMTSQSYNLERKQTRLKSHPIQKKKHKKNGVNENSSRVPSSFDETRLKSILKKSSSYLEPDVSSFVFDLQKEEREKKRALPFVSENALKSKPGIYDDVEYEVIEKILSRESKPAKKVTFCLRPNTPRKSLRKPKPRKFNEVPSDDEVENLNSTQSYPEGVPKVESWIKSMLNDLGQPQNVFQSNVPLTPKEEPLLTGRLTTSKEEKSHRVLDSKESKTSLEEMICAESIDITKRKLREECDRARKNSSQALDFEKHASLDEMTAPCKIRTDSIDIQKRKIREECDRARKNSSQVLNFEKHASLEEMTIPCKIRTDSIAVLKTVDKEGQRNVPFKHQNFTQVLDSKGSFKEIIAPCKVRTNSIDTLAIDSNLRSTKSERRGEGLGRRWQHKKEIQSDTNVYCGPCSYNKPKTDPEVPCKTKKSDVRSKIVKKFESLQRRQVSEDTQVAKAHNLQHIVTTTTDYLCCNLKILMERFS